MQNMMMTWQQSGGLTAGLAVVAGGLRLKATGTKARWIAAFATEACVIAALYTLWQYLGQMSLMSVANAFERGRRLAHFEQIIGLPSERRVQDLILDHHWIVELANYYYDVMHFSVMFVFLLWLFVRHRDRYYAIRTTLALATLSCLAIQLLPVAPPRLVGGYVDTAMEYGQSVYQGNLAGQLFAMPSVHVTWAVLVGWYAYQVSRSWWRLLAVAHMVLTVFVVVATGNHWWLDGVVGVAVLVACAWARYGVARAWRASRSAWRAALDATTPDVTVADVAASDVAASDVAAGLATAMRPVAAD